MSTAISLVIVLATAAFGAVYAWGYVPLLVAAALIGVYAISRNHDVPREISALAIAIFVTAGAVVAQIIPVSRGVLQALSPRAMDLLTRYSIGFGGSASHAISINPASTRLALAGLIALGLYAVGASLALSHHDLKHLPRNLLVFAVILALVGIFGREHNNGLVYGFWQPEEGTNGNGFGPFVNRNHFAGWMLMATCLSIGAFLGHVEVARGRVSSGFRKRVLWLSSRSASRIILITGGLVVTSVSLVWTMSRSAIISFACAIAFFAWLVAGRRQSGDRTRVACLAILGALLVASLRWRGVDHLADWFSDTNDYVSRWAAWHDGWSVVRDFGLVGTGLNTYPDAMLFYQRNIITVWMTHAHNDYLQLLAEGGLLVALPTASCGVVLTWAIRRRLKELSTDSYGYWIRAGAAIGIVSIAIQESVEFSLHIPANAFLFTTLVAIAISGAEKETRTAAGSSALR